MGVEFIKSATRIEELPYDKTKEFCFIGRSNVGKSTLINSLVNQKIAFSSKTPGRTQLINIFKFKNFRLIDLPGYGYANVSKQKNKQMRNMIDEYILNRENLKCVFQICDIQVITMQDKQVCDYLKENKRDFYLILNKIDKISKNQINANINKIINFFDVEKNKLLLVSAKKKEGIKNILNIIEKF